MKPIEKVLPLASLIFLVREGEVLLARKTKKIGAGKLNGYGGGPEEGESLEVCGARELSEESGVTVDPKDLEKVAEVTFHNNLSDGGTFSCVVHVYLCRRWSDEPTASSEMADPRWYSVGNLLLTELMPADPYWLPLILAGKKIRATAHYTPFQQELIGAVEITEVKNFD